MRTPSIVSTLIVLSVTTVSHAQDDGDPLATAQEQYSAGNFDAALEQLEPLLQANAIDQKTQERTRALAARLLHLRGEAHFRQARVAEAIADFDRQVELQPDQAAEHWQRGIAYYYAGQYEKGARQFALHQTVNPEDVENAAWHFLCLARAPKGSVETARAHLIPVRNDSRLPMAQIQQMLAGTMTPQEVLRAGDEAGGAAKFYADLYAGLYLELLGRDDDSLRLIRLAANNMSLPESYMRDVARTHVILRSGEVLRHAVFFKFKAAAAKSDVDRVVKAFRQLPSKIKEIQGFQAGENISRLGLSDGFTHCFLLTFKSESDRAAYLPHPEHKSFGAALGPFLDGVFVIDYWARPQATGLKKELKHAVFVQFNGGTSAEDVRTIENALTGLPSKIDAIKAFEWGKNNSPESHDEKFTHCFMYTFASEAALKEYMDHPAHGAAATALHAKAEKIRVLDFWTDDTVEM